MKTEEARATAADATEAVEGAIICLRASLEMGMPRPVSPASFQLVIMLTMAVYVIATLDTKGHEAAFVCERLESLGVATTLVDVGCLGEPETTADISRETVFAAAGTSLPEQRAQGDRGTAIDAAARGLRSLALEAQARGELDGILGLGGSAGTTISTQAMRALPLGLPKLMVSTLASGQVRAWVGDRDITMVNSVVDILGLNRISRVVLGNAAAAMAGMAHSAPTDDAPHERPLVAATMFGVTTPCVEQAKAVLEQAGYEVLVFHATGNGGEAMETLIREGLFAGVLDVTTTELADELLGGVLSAGPTRLTAAAECGVPQVVSVGALDMVNFHGRDSVPAHFAGRRLHAHNSAVTLMRTNAEECATLGTCLAEKVAMGSGPRSIFLPRAGLSAIDAPGQPFEDQEARAALFSAIRAGAGSAPVVELDHHINDTEFATALADELMSLMEATA